MRSILQGRRSLALMLAVGNLFTFSILPSLAASVQLGGSPVFNVPGGSAAADKIQHNIDNSLVASSDHGPSSVKITYVKGVPVITLGGYLVTTVDTATAKANGTTPSILAQKWANSLRTALSNKTHVESYIAQLTGTSYSAGGTAAASLPASSSKPVKLSPAKSAPQAVASRPRPSSAPSYSKASAQQSDAGSVTPFSQSSISSAGSSNMGAVDDQTQYGMVHRGRVVYIPAGMTINAKLATSLSSSVAKAGDMILAKTTDPIDLGNGTLPPGSILTGQVTDASAGKHMAKSGKLSIKFTTIKTPDGAETPITAHLSGDISKYTSANTESGSTLSGENSMSKVKRAAVATAVGAGAGAMLGLTVGSIAGGGRGAARGVWSGTAIGAGLGLAEAFLIRKGSEVNVMQGENVKLQLDAPASIAMGAY